METGQVALANGGHPYPIVLTREGELREIEMPSLPLGMALPFGVTHNVAELGVEMATGIPLIFYSDGITDIQDEDGEFYGDERFLLS